MAETIAIRRGLYWALFLGLALLFMFLRLLPLDTTPGGLPGPDLLLLMSFAWVLRRPDYVPVLLVALTTLAADVIFLRPLGLWTVFAVLGVEFLRAREGGARDMPFWVEWMLVAGTITGVSLAYALTLAVFMVPQPGLLDWLAQTAMTILCYPLVVFASARMMGLRKPAPGAVDSLGRKL